MKKEPISAIRWDIIARLYERLRKQDPGSQEAEITEHAIDLVLNRKEESLKQEYLFYDALKNARFSRRRTYQRHYNFLQQISRRMKNSSHNQTPESCYVYKEIYSTIIKRIDATNPSSLRCLEGMLIRESIAETAGSINTSMRSVNRARKHIRKIAYDCFVSYGFDC